MGFTLKRLKRIRTVTPDDLRAASGAGGDEVQSCDPQVDRFSQPNLMLVVFISPSATFDLKENPEILFYSSTVFELQGPVERNRS